MDARSIRRGNTVILIVFLFFILSAVWALRHDGNTSSDEMVWRTYAERNGCKLRASTDAGNYYDCNGRQHFRPRAR